MGRYAFLLLLLTSCGSDAPLGASLGDPAPTPAAGGGSGPNDPSPVVPAPGAPTANPQLEGAFTFLSIQPSLGSGRVEFPTEAIFGRTDFVLYATRYGDAEVARIAGTYTAIGNHLHLTPTSVKPVLGSVGPPTSLLPAYDFLVDPTQLALDDVGATAQHTIYSRVPTYCNHVDDCGLQGFAHETCAGEARCVARSCVWACTSACSSSSTCGPDQICNAAGACAAACPMVTKPALACSIPAGRVGQMIIGVEANVPHVDGAERQLTGCEAKAWAQVAAAYPEIGWKQTSQRYFYVDNAPTAQGPRCALLESLWQLPFVFSADSELGEIPPPGL